MDGAAALKGYHPAMRDAAVYLTDAWQDVHWRKGMKSSLYSFLDCFFLVFHALFALFNITGWILKKTRFAHLLTMTATLFSWTILGIWHGFGYCFFTDWHWRIREYSGKPVESWSYIHFLIKEITSIDLNPYLVDRITFSVFTLALALTVILNIRDRLKK